MAYHRCKFCGDNINGRQNLQAHRRQNHQAEMAPGKVFQYFSGVRERGQQVDVLLREWDERDGFLNSGISHQWPAVREMVAKKHLRPKYRGWNSERTAKLPDSPQTRGEILDEQRRLDMEIIAAKDYWFAWVHSPANTYTNLELAVLVIIWNGKDNFRADDHKQLKDWMAKSQA